MQPLLRYTGDARKDYAGVPSNARRQRTLESGVFFVGQRSTRVIGEPVHQHRRTAQGSLVGLPITG